MRILQWPRSLVKGLTPSEMRGLKQRRLPTKYKLAIFGVCSALLFCLVHVNKGLNNKYSVELRFFRENQEFLDAVNATDCKLPKYDLYDPDILKYVKQPPTPIACGYPQPYLTFMDWSGYLYLNRTEVVNHDYRDLVCIYEAVRGDKDNDYKVWYENSTDIKTFPILIEDPVIRVSCSNKGDSVYKMIHSQIRPLNQSTIDANNAIPAHRPSVLIFTIDSMSRGNFIRTLPKTYKYLLDKHNMNVFKGLTKVADNTFPNMMALLTGFSGYHRPEMPHIPVWTIKENSTMKRYDDLPAIWKSFQKDGYITMYAEEYLDATFSLLDVGFQNDPVDYYYRSSYVSMKQNLGSLHKDTKWNNHRYCVGNEPSYKYIMNYTEEFLTEMSDKKYFAFSFLVEVSHDYLNDIKNLDGEFLEFFERMYDGGMFNNTVLLVMGDHGHRFDAIRSTFIGRIEERMPFLGIILPESLRKSHPHLQLALESHSERLLSWFDIHEALVDISLDDLMEMPMYPRPRAVGKSVFKFFEENRTCTEIGILPEYCMCDRESQIPTSSPKAYSSAKLVVATINKLLKTSSSYYKDGETRTCSKLTLHRVVSATMAMRSFSANSSLLVRVILEAYPSKGLFEAAVEFSPAVKPRVLGDINRINKYGSQPSCISHDILRLYCYCV